MEIVVDRDGLFLDNLFGLIGMHLSDKRRYDGSGFASQVTYREVLGYNSLYVANGKQYYDLDGEVLGYENSETNHIVTFIRYWFAGKGRDKKKYSLKMVASVSHLYSVTDGRYGLQDVLDHIESYVKSQ